jgi:hypothetical protein
MSLLLTVSGKPGPALPSIGGVYDTSAQCWHSRLAGFAMAETSVATVCSTTSSVSDVDTDDQAPDPDPDEP